MILLMPMIPTPIDAEAGAATTESRRPTVAAPASASPELTARPHRRIFTAQDKLRILADTDRAWFRICHFSVTQACEDRRPVRAGFGYTVVRCGRRPASPGQARWG